MKTCPYCKFPIEENWSYCRNCNKPLITNLKDVIDGDIKFPYDEPEIYHLEMEDDNDRIDEFVIKDDELVGVISVEDLVNWLTEGARDCPIKDKMTTDINVIYADEPLIHAASKLEKTGFRRLPVIDRKDKKLVGVITKDGIIENHD